MCAKACDSWIHTSVLKESRYLVLGGSRDTVEGTQLGQSLHKVSVLSIQGAYSDSCHGKVLEITKKNCENKDLMKFYCTVSRDIKSLSLSLREFSTVRTLLIPHITCVLCGSGKLK